MSWKKNGCLRGANSPRIGRRMYANRTPSTAESTTYPLLEVSCRYIACTAVTRSHKHIYQDKFESRTALAILDFLAFSMMWHCDQALQFWCSRLPREKTKHTAPYKDRRRTATVALLSMQLPASWRFGSIITTNFQAVILRLKIKRPIGALNEWQNAADESTPL